MNGTTNQHWNRPNDSWLISSVYRPKLPGNHYRQWVFKPLSCLFYCNQIFSDWRRKTWTPAVPGGGEPFGSCEPIPWNPTVRPARGLSINGDTMWYLLTIQWYSHYYWETTIFGAVHHVWTSPYIVVSWINVKHNTIIVINIIIVIIITITIIIMIILIISAYICLITQIRIQHHRVNMVSDQELWNQLWINMNQRLTMANNSQQWWIYGSVCFQLPL